MSDRKMKLTVVFRNEMPMLAFNDTPTHRTVVLRLTDEQVAKLTPRSIGHYGPAGELRESIAYYILEDVPND